MGHLRSTLHTNPSFIYMVQEPYVREGKMIGFDKSHLLFYDHSSLTPRSAIYASKDLHLWPMPEFTAKDITTCLWLTHQDHLPKVIIASVYMDHTDLKVWPDTLTKLLRYCRSGRHKLILAADTNGHSSLWGSEDTNTQGKAIEELVFLNNLAILNVGNHPTFYNRRCSSIIDVTFSSEDMVDSVKDWMVDTSFMDSDHHLITFNIMIRSPKPISVRNLKKATGKSVQAPWRKCLWTWILPPGTKPFWTT